MAAGLGTASLRVVANTTVFEQTLKRSLKRMSALTAGIFAGAAAGNFLGGAVKDAVALEKQVALIKTMLKGVAPEVQKAFSLEGIRDLSNEVGIGADKVADALYYIIGSGVPAAKAMDAFRAASAAAVGTNSDVALTANFTTTALNAYGEAEDSLTKKALTAAHANDIFTKSIMEGKGTANDMAKYISSVIDPAAALGVGLGEVAAAGAAATLNGKSARKVFTGLQYVITGLGDTSKGVGEAFQEITGKSFKQFVKDGGNLKQAIKILGDEIGDSQLANLAGAKQGTLGIQGLLNVWNQYTEIQKKMAGSEGEAVRARDLVNESTSRQLDFLKTQFVNFRGSVGDWLLPVILRGLAAIDVIKPKISAFFSELAAGIAAGWAVVAPLFENGIDLFREGFAKVDWPALKSIIMDVFAGIAIGLAPFVVAAGVVLTIFGQLSLLLGPLVDLLKNMSPIIVGLVAVWTAWHVALMLVNSQLLLSIARSIAGAAAYVISAGGIIIATIATDGWAAAWVALSVAMSVNPIGLAIAAVAALVVGLIYAWKTSETFRHVVLTAFAAIVTGVGTAVKFLVELATAWVKGYLYAFKAILDGLKWVPKWAGGGAIDGAAAAVQNVIDGVNAIERSIDSLIDKAIDGAKALAALVSVQDEGFGTQGLDQVYDQLAKDYPNGVGGKAPKAAGSGGGTKTPDFSGAGGWTPDAKKDTKKAASEAAKAIKAAMGRIKADLNRIAKNTSKQTTDTIKNNFDQLYADLKDAKVAKSVIKSAQKIEKELLKLANKRDKITLTLEKEKDTLKSLEGQYKDTVRSMMKSFSELGDIANTDRMRTVFRQGIFPTASNQIQNLKRALYISDRFAAAIKKLQKLGLKKTSLDELIAAGPEGGLGAAEGLARGGAGAVKEVNNLQDQLNRNGKALGASLADQFYGHGIEASKGLIAGLEKDRDKILKVMDKMGDQMAASFKKKLGIKSPSKVFEGFGEQITAGLGIGIAGGVGKANGPTSGGSASVTFGPGAIVVNGVKNGDEQKGGMLTGRGIVGVLESRSTAAALAGIGG